MAEVNVQGTSADCCNLKSSTDFRILLVPAVKPNHMQLCQCIQFIFLPLQVLPNTEHFQVLSSNLTILIDFLILSWRPLQAVLGVVFSCLVNSS